jgi:hypothetical protein
MSKQCDSKNRFGTFGGVFTPSILTILGVIMFMRANFVVGQAGVLGALLFKANNPFLKNKFATSQKYIVISKRCLIQQICFDTQLKNP